MTQRKRLCVLVLARVACGCFLVLAGVLKLASTYDPLFFLSQSSYYTVAAIEVALGIVCATRRWRCAMWGAMITAAGGMIYLALGLQATCGCFGSHLQITAEQHMIVASLLGGIACVGLWAGTGFSPARPVRP